MSRPVRYTIILTLVALGTCLAAAGGWRYARASAPVNGPIILLSIDALRADHLPAYGYRKVNTPAIDSLAADGIVFERAYSHVPQTLPAHASLLTGRLPFETGARDTAGFELSAGERLLPEMLGDRGFATAGIVSSSLLQPGTGITQGFAFFDAEMPESQGGDPALRRDAAESERVAERWFDTAGTSRAFLFLHLDVAPVAPESELDGRAAELPAYDRSIARVDESVGNLLRYLKARQLYDRSTIILVSAHGEGLGDHGEQGHGLLLYDDTLRVPLIVKQAGAEGAGRRVASAVQHVDVVPTILDLAKAPAPGNLRGRSLVAVLSGDQDVPVGPVYAESLYGRYHFGWSEIRSIVDGTYRYIQAPEEELYDLEADPQEQENLATSKPDVVARFRELLKDFGPGVASAPRAVGDEERARLEAFGHVGVTTTPDGAASTVNPKDKWLLVEQYRLAAALAAKRDWTGAADAFRTLAHQEPSMSALWMRLGASALRAERLEMASDAFKRVLELEPANLDAHLAAALASLRLRRFEEVRIRTATVLADAAASLAHRSSAYELLARVALLRRNFALAREQAALADGVMADRPVGAFIEGRIAFEQKHYEDALASFEAAEALLKKTGAPRIDDLQLFTAESLIRLDRLPEAEYLLSQVLKETPQNARARADLRTLSASAANSDK